MVLIEKKFTQFLFILTPNLPMKFTFWEASPVWGNEVIDIYMKGIGLETENRVWRTKTHQAILIIYLEVSDNTIIV